MLEAFRQNVLDAVQPSRHNWIEANPNNDADPDDEQCQQLTEFSTFDADRMRQARKTGALAGGIAALFAGIVIVTVLRLDRPSERFTVIGCMGLGGAIIGLDLIAKQIYREEED